MRLKQPSPLPGFALALGYTLFYLCLIVLLPLAALVAEAAGLGLRGIWQVASEPRVMAALRTSFGLSLAAAVTDCAFGLLIATMGKTAEATRGIAILATLLMVMLGGAWVPTFVFPKWLRAVAVVFPTRWAMDGLDAVTWRGLDFSSVALQIALLFACAAVFGGLALMRFRWEAD